MTKITTSEIHRRAKARAQDKRDTQPRHRCPECGVELEIVNGWYACPQCHRLWYRVRK